MKKPKLYSNLTTLIDADKFKDFIKKLNECCESLTQKFDQETLAKALDFCSENQFSGISEPRFQNDFSEKSVKVIGDLVKQGQLNLTQIKDVSQQLSTYIRDSKEEILKKKSNQFIEANALIVCYQAYNLLTIHTLLKDAGQAIQNDQVFSDLKTKADKARDQIEIFQTTNESAKGKQKKRPIRISIFIFLNNFKIGEYYGH